ncbi:MAG: GlsB/YeaQ/YmgE family stress response membrane protein [Akkermansiaceae bacterium]
MIGSIIGWVLLGVIAGAIAKFLMPGKDPGGCLTTMIIGIVGAFLGGWLGRFVDFLPANDPGSWLPSIASIVTATVGAFVLLLIFRLIKK